MQSKTETTTSSTTTHYDWNDKDQVWVPDRKTANTETVVSIHGDDS